MLAALPQPVCGHGVHCAVGIHCIELQQHRTTAEQQACAEQSAKGLQRSISDQTQLAAPTPEQSTPPQLRQPSPEGAMDVGCSRRAASQPEPGRPAAQPAAGAHQQTVPAAGSGEVAHSRSSSDTQAAWATVELRGPQPDIRSEEQHQQQQGAAAEQGQQTSVTALAQGARQQQQSHHHHRGSLQQCQQEQLQPGSFGQRPFGWWRQQGGPNMWRALDPVRLPLLQAHNLLGGCGSGSHSLLELLARSAPGCAVSIGTGEQTAAAAVYNSTHFTECWKHLQAGAEAKLAAQHRQWQQQREAAAAAATAAAAAAAAPHPGCEVPEEVATRLLQQQQQLEGRPLLPSRPLALASRTAACDDSSKHSAVVAAAADGSSMAMAMSKQHARKAAAAALAAAAPSAATASAAAAPSAAAAAAPAAAAAAAARPPVPKPPKRLAKGSRPWQPKLAPVEPNWNQALFSSVTTRAAAAVAHSSSSRPLKPLPDQDTAKFAMLMLLHGAGWPNALLWQRWQAEHPKGEVALMVHIKAGVDMAAVRHGREAILRHRLHTSVDARWGDISLVEAQLESMAEVLRRCPHVTHIGLASGHDIPVQLMKPGLLLPGVSMFGMYQFPDKETRTLKVATLDELVDNTELGELEAQNWGRALLFHHQWMVLAREHAAALVMLSKEISVIGRVIHKACNSVRAGMAPDEFIMLTALRAAGYVRSIQRVELKAGMQFAPGTLLNSYPTLVLFPAESSPHPVLWTDPDEVIQCQVERHTGEQYFKKLSLTECLKISQQRCALFFRKVEIRQTRGEELARVLSLLEELWLSGAGSSTSGGSRSRGKRKRGGRARSGSKGPVNKLLDAAAATDSSPAASSAADTAAGSESGREDDDEAQTPPKRPASEAGR